MTAPFKVVWRGNLPPEDVRLKRSSTFAFQRSQESETALEAEWQRRLEAGLAEWPNDRKPSRYRLSEVACEAGVLQLQVHPCVSYRDAIGATHAFVTAHGEAFNPNPLAVTFLIVTRDNKIPISIREKVDYKRGGWHASGGGYLEHERQESPWKATLREMHEELCIAPREVIQARCIGVVYDPWMPHSDAIFRVCIDVESHSLKERKGDTENQGILFIDHTSTGIDAFITRAPHAGTISGLAALVGSFELLSDEEAQQAMTRFLYGEFDGYDDPEVRRSREARDINLFRGLVAQISI